MTWFGPWTPEKSGDFKGLFEPFTGAKAVDAYTIDIKTKKPYGLLLAMATYIFPMDSKAFYTGTDEKGNSPRTCHRQNRLLFCQLQPIRHRQIRGVRT
jgi:ABC-type transport system substrate-binding protein